MPEWPLVGRGSDLKELIGCLAAGRPGVVLAGAAGVGKTRLAVEFLQHCASQGFTTIRVAATEITSRVPLGAFAVLLPELRPGIDRLEMLREVARAVADAGKGEPVALLVDDAHLLDETSAALTYQLVATEKVFLIATVRSAAAVPAPVLALWTDGLAERIELDALAEGQVEELLESVLGGPLDVATRRLLFQRSAGNVLYLRELVLAALGTGVLHQDGGLWRIRGRLPASARLVELVETRLSVLRDEDRRAVELLTVGEPLGIEFFERLVGVEAVVGLEHHHLVSVEEQDRRLNIRVAHPLYREVLHALLPPVRNRLLCRALADALEATGARRRDDLLRLATWRLDGGGDVQAATMLAAAERAWILDDIQLAGRFAKAAVDRGGGFPAELLMAQVMSLSGEGEEAERRLSALESQAKDDGERGRLAIARIENLCYSLGRLDQGLTVAEDASRTIADAGWRDELTAYRADLLVTGGQTAQALDVAAPLLERAGGDALIRTCVMAGYGYARTGQLSKAVEVADRGLVAHRALTERAMPFNTSHHVAIRCLALAFSGRLVEAEEEALAEVRRGTALGSDEGLWTAGLVLGMTYLLQGRVATALRWARETAAAARQHGRLVYLRAALIPMAEALALLGRADEAAGVLVDLKSLPIPSVQLWMPEALRAQAWLAVARGNMAEAAAQLEKAAAVANAAGELVCESAALHDLARLGGAPVALARLAELAGVVEGDFVCARARHAEAIAGRDPEAFDSVSQRFEGFGARLFAAEAAADAAVAWRRAGDSRRANAAERRSREFAGACEGAKTPALATASSARTVLTARELEIARLAASGRSNKEIAELLHLSVKSVENKLYDSYEKLGVRGRRELAGALEGL